MAEEPRVIAFKRYAQRFALNDLKAARSPSAALWPFLLVALRGSTECPTREESFESWVRRVKSTDTLRFVHFALGELGQRLEPRQASRALSSGATREHTELFQRKTPSSVAEGAESTQRAVSELLLHEEERFHRFLANAYRRVSRRDDYGDEDPTALNIEVERFIKKLLQSHKSFAPEWELRLFETHGVAFLQSGRLRGGRLEALDGALRARFEAHRRDVSRQARALPRQEQFRAMSGADFEAFLEKFLRRSGLRARRVGATGDQGADLLVNVEIGQVVIQAKNVKNNVGNKAVQEVHAARGFYRATAAFVVTTARFTRGARELAVRLGVELVEGSELATLPSRLMKHR